MSREESFSDYLVDTLRKVKNWCIHGCWEHPVRNSSSGLDQSRLTFVVLGRPRVTDGVDLLPSLLKRKYFNRVPNLFYSIQFRTTTRTVSHVQSNIPYKFWYLSRKDTDGIFKGEVTGQYLGGFIIGKP